jgi:3-methyladenine DNA glycosylase AlkD
MASLAVHDKGDTNSKFLTFLKVVEGASPDDRNFVKKAVNWALRQIGKRNKTLNNAAIATAERMKNSDSKAMRWIASDALRELNSPKVQSRLSSS